MTCLRCDEDLPTDDTKPCRTCHACRVCGGGRGDRRGRCMTCYRYWKRNGGDRQEQMIIRASRRRFGLSA